MFNVAVTEAFFILNQNVLIGILFNAASALLNAMGIFFRQNELLFALGIQVLPIMSPQTMNFRMFISFYFC